MSSAADDFPCAFHIALDGNGLNGLEGRAGVCVFRYDPRTGRYAYTIEYYDGSRVAMRSASARTAGSASSATSASTSCSMTRRR